MARCPWTSGLGIQKPWPPSLSRHQTTRDQDEGNQGKMGPPKSSGARGPENRTSAFGMISGPISVPLVVQGIDANGQLPT